MQRLLFGLAAAAGLALSAGPAQAADVASVTAAGFYATSAGPQHTRVNAIDHGAGNITGTYSAHLPGSGDHLIGDITCLGVYGNEATIGVHVTKSSGAFASDPVGSNFYVYLGDSGRPQDNLIATSGFLPAGPGPVFCPPGVPSVPFDGPIEIHHV